MNEYGLNVSKALDWQASWIWLRGHEKAVNDYVRFRRTFKLSGAPRTARFHVTACSHYRLFVNGTEIGFGPNPNVPKRYFFDSYDLASVLRKGNNLIAVMGYNFGSFSRHDSCHPQPMSGGLIFQLDVELADGSVKRVVSDRRCRASASPAWDADTPEYCELRHGFKEYVDGRKRPMTFIFGARSEGKWENAAELGKHPMPPFETLVPRKIKYFATSEALPVNAYSFCFNKAYGFTPDRGWEIDDPMALVGNYPKGTHLRMLMGGEGGDLRGMEEKNTTDTNCRVQMINPDQPPMLVVDFGEIQVGRLQFDLEDAPAGAKIDVGYGESLNVTFVDRYVTRDGAQSFETFHRRVGRYVVLRFSDLNKPLTVKTVRFNSFRYPVRRRGSFDSSDRELNDIWKISERTTDLCMFDHFEDCPWREQKLYSGDMQIQATAADYAYADWDYVGKCFEQLGTLKEDGWIAHAGPGWFSKSVILDFPARYIIGLEEHVLHSGDLKLLRKVYPNVLRQIETYEGMARTRDLIDLGDRKGFEFWCFLNWSVIDKSGVVTAFNCLVIQAMAVAARLAAILGKDADARSLNERVKVLRKNVVKTLWDRKTGLFIDCLHDGRRSDIRSVESSVAAILSECADAAMKKSIIAKLRRTDRPWLTRTAFFNTFLMEVLFEAGEGAAALKLIHWYWGEMIRRGADAFWEGFDFDTPPGALPHKVYSLCHGFSAGPLPLIGKYVLGVRPVKPGFAETVVKPWPLIDRAKGTVPTPRGDIRVEWDRDKAMVRIKVPKRVKARIDKRHCGGFRVVLD